MSKSRAKISDEAFERVATGLVEALERGTEAWPLPEPPISDPDFPPIAPTSPHALFEEGLGMLSVDRGMFDRHLNTVVDLIVPHRMNLTDDPYEVHQKWLSRRMDDVADRLLFHIATDWLAQAFDPHAPNTDRWWLSIALVNGLATVAHGQPVHQGYHLIESIALAERPGTWHTQPDAGPQHMDWNPHAVVPRMANTVVAHERFLAVEQGCQEKFRCYPFFRRHSIMMQRNHVFRNLDDLFVNPTHVSVSFHQVWMQRYDRVFVHFDRYELPDGYLPTVGNQTIDGHVGGLS